VSWLALGGAGLVQLLAAVVRVRGWWHVIRKTRPEWCELRYRDVALAQVGGMGWNAVLPARAGDAVKIALVNRRLSERHLAALTATLVPTGLVEALFTVILVIWLLLAGVVSAATLHSALPQRTTALIVGAAVCVALVAAVVFRRRLGKLVRDVRSGLATLGHPRILATKVLPWQLAGRVLRLLAFALVLTAAGLPFGFAPALALMALQGATPSAGAAATAARIGLLSLILAKTGAGDVSAKHVAEVLGEAYGITSVMNLAASAGVIAWELRTLSPRRVFAYARTALRSARSGKLRTADYTGR
jgi:hypothetical protein